MDNSPASYSFHPENAVSTELIDSELFNILYYAFVVEKLLVLVLNMQNEMIFNTFTPWQFISVSLLHT